jgi:hypothetical protein
MVGHRLARVQLDDLSLSAVVGLFVVGGPFLRADHALISHPGTGNSHCQHRQE